MPKIAPGSIALTLSLVALTLLGMELGGLSAVEGGENYVKQTSLVAYVGGQLKEPCLQLAAMYEKKTGVKVELIFNNSGFLLTQLETGRKGDVFIPGDMSFIDKARDKGMVADVTAPLASHVPVIATPKGNPAGIEDVRDLAKPGVKLLMPDAKATAIGGDAIKVFDRLGITAQVEKNTVASMATPSQVLAALLMGQGNAAVVSYNAIGKAEGKIDIIRIDPKVNVIGTIHCAVLSFAEHPGQARNFEAFLVENAPGVFAACGFQSAP